MFVDANDEKWSVEKMQNLSHIQPLTVCFMDEYGNSFLNRVKECIGKNVLVALAIPFECFVEREDKILEKRKGFLMVNDYLGMMYGYGLLNRLKQDFIASLSKKDVHLLRRKGILCFLNYGSVYMEFGRELWLKKEYMEKPLAHMFLRKFAKNPKRFLYDFQHRRPTMIPLPVNATDGGHPVKQMSGIYHPKCTEVIDLLRKENIPFMIKEEGLKETVSYTCKIALHEKEARNVYRLLSQKLFIKQGVTDEPHHECWILEKMPVQVDDEKMYLEAWQCEWLQIPHINIIKTP